MTKTKLSIIERLKKAENTARKLENLKRGNQNKWEKLFKLAQKSPEWKEYCEKTGCVENYEYYDLLC